MGTEKALLSQKEYLKRYLGKDKNKKKRKKEKISSSSHIKRSVIIDDDLGLKDIASIDDEEFNLNYLGDEAPQIVGVIDERPTELKAKEKYNSNLWLPIGDEGADNSIQLSKVDTSSNSVGKNYSDNSDISVDRPTKNQSFHKKMTEESIKYQDEKCNNYKKERKVEKQSEDSDLSPARKYNKNDNNTDSDMSPPRLSKSKKKKSYEESEIRGSNVRKNYLPKKSREYPKEDNGISKGSKAKTKQRTNDDSDSDYQAKGSKRRRGDKHDKSERSTKNREGEKLHHSLTSRFKNNDKNYESRNIGKSVSTTRACRYNDIPNNSRRFKNKDDSDFSPARNYSPPNRMKKNKSDFKEHIEEKMLDGKTSGLQDSKHLKEELKRLREDEDHLFKKLDPTMLGANAAPIKRDRKTGKVRNVEREKEEDKAKAEKKAKTDDKYYRWGKGLRQMQEQEDRIADAVHEMSKPLARYRDDKDLDAFLKAQEREGDPMLDYIRNKQAESHNVIDLTVSSSKPKYNGSFMPNRFGIAPGYRWDGVDRSNGYEKKWFEQKNARKAIEEQAYKWSTSDM